MQAIAVEQGRGKPAIRERERPDPAAGEVLVRTLRVGVDGTDHEVIAGNHGEFPEGENHLVLGHEAVGVVEDGRHDPGGVPNRALGPRGRLPVPGAIECEQPDPV